MLQDKAKYNDGRYNNRNNGDRDSQYGDRDSRDDDPNGRMHGKVFFKKKICKFCTNKAKINYKDPETLYRFITDRGKILPRRITGSCARHQREVSHAIKRARAICLLPYVKE